MKHIKTPIRYCDEDWMLFDADDEWLASLDMGETGPEIAHALNAYDALLEACEAESLLRLHLRSCDAFDIQQGFCETCLRLGARANALRDAALALAHGEVNDD